jgi:hypothetical protein
MIEYTDPYLSANILVKRETLLLLFAEDFR